MTGSALDPPGAISWLLAVVALSEPAAGHVRCAWRSPSSTAGVASSSARSRGADEAYTGLIHGPARARVAGRRGSAVAPSPGGSDPRSVRHSPEFVRPRLAPDPAGRKGPSPHLASSLPWEAPRRARVPPASSRGSRAPGMSLGPQPRSRAARPSGHTWAHLRKDHRTIVFHWLAAAGGTTALYWRAVACALGLMLVGLSVGTLVTPRISTMYDTDIMMLVTQNLLTKGSFQVPPDGFNGPYSTYGFGMSLVYVVPYLLASHLHRDVVSWMLLSGPVLFALTLSALLWLTVGCGATRRQGVVTTLLVGFGTLLVAYVPTGLSELGVALGIAVGLASLTAVPRDPKRAGAVAGAAAGLTVLMRADSLLLVVPILAVGAWVLGGRRRLPLLAFGAGAAPWLLMVAAYNVLRFGAPWRLGYEGTAVFDHSLLAGLYGLVLSPGRGLVWYVPLVLVAMLGFPRALRRFPTLTVVALALILVRIPVYGTFWAWTGGPGVWGPRYLAPAMPALAPGILEVIRRFRMLPSPSRVVVIAVATVSVLVQLPGTLVNPSEDPANVASARAWAGLPHRWDILKPEVVARGDVYFFDWSYFSIAGEMNELLHRQYLESRFFPGGWLEPGPWGRGPTADNSPQPGPGTTMLLASLLFVGLGFAWLMSREARQGRFSGPAGAPADRLTMRTSSPTAAGPPHLVIRKTSSASSQGSTSGGRRWRARPALRTARPPGGPADLVGEEHDDTS